MNQAFSPIVGILDLQGDVMEHRLALERCSANVISVKTQADLARVDGLVIPGGESTTIGKLIHWYGLGEAICTRVLDGMPVYGTCAGAILLSKTISSKEKAQNLGLMNIEIERNAYGRQIESFEAEVSVDESVFHRLHEDPSLCSGLPAVFIRAPKIKTVGETVVPLAQWGSEIVMAREGNILISTFHPELTENPTIHRYFLTMIHERSRS